MKNEETGCCVDCRSWRKNSHLDGTHCKAKGQCTCHHPYLEETPLPKDIEESNWEEEFDKKFRVEGIKVHGSANSIKNFIALLLSQHRTKLLETLRGKVDEMEKCFGDTGKPDGYCNFCLDHVSQHGNKNNRCGCDYFNAAIKEVLALLQQLKQ